jgi:hypothetical protein
LKGAARVCTVNGLGAAVAQPLLMPLVSVVQMAVVRGLQQPSIDPLQRFFAYGPDTRSVLAVSISLFIIIVTLSPWNGIVYLGAVLPGYLTCRYALNKYPGHVTGEQFCRTVLVGILFTFFILVYEYLVELVVLVTAPLVIGSHADSGSYFVVGLEALGQAFLVAALCEEWIKFRITRRAVHVEGASNPTAIMLHAAAGSAAFASLENVLYCNFRTGGDIGTTITRAVLCIPAHIAWGISSGSAYALFRIRNGNADVIPWGALIGIMGPSVLLHGIWDFVLFFSSAATSAYNKRRLMCLETDYAGFSSGFGSDYAGLVSPNPSSSEVFFNCLNSDPIANHLLNMVTNLYITILVMTFTLPFLSLYVMYARVKCLRAAEAVVGADLEQPPQPSASDTDFVQIIQTVPSSSHDQVIISPPPLTAQVSSWTRADVGNWLASVGLGQYIDAFKPVNGAILLSLSDTDLQELGVSVAVHRRAVAELIGRNEGFL